MNIDDLCAIYQVSSEYINNILKQKGINVRKNSIPKKYIFDVVSFLEKDDCRIQSIFPNAYTTYALNRKQRIAIFRQDVIRFLQSLPTNSIDIITTDPAYNGMNQRLQLGKGRIVGQYSNKGHSTGKWFAEFDDSEENYRLFLTECKRVLRKTTGHIYLMFDPYSLLTLAPIVREFFDVKNLITWDKVNIGMGHYYRRQTEMVIFATNNNKRNLSARNFSDLWSIKRLHNAKYPTQKPVALFEHMLDASMGNNTDYWVCDPFLGSGAAGIAALKKGCNFVGCDISTSSLALASKRFSSMIHNNIDIGQ